MVHRGPPTTSAASSPIRSRPWCSRWTRRTAQPAWPLHGGVGIGTVFDERCPAGWWSRPGPAKCRCMKRLAARPTRSTSQERIRPSSRS